MELSVITVMDFSHIKGTNTLVTKIWLKVMITLINVSTQISGIKVTGNALIIEYYF